MTIPPFNTDFVNDGAGTSFLWRALIDVTSAGLFNNDLYFKGRDSTLASGLPGLYKVRPTLASAPLPLTWLNFEAILNDDGVRTIKAPAITAPVASILRHPDPFKHSSGGIHHTPSTRSV